MPDNEKKAAVGPGYNPMKEPRFTDIATFMRAPLADSLEGLDIALIGVPTDLGVTNRPGARHGPREIRNASSLMRVFNLAMGINPYDICRIADIGDDTGAMIGSELNNLLSSIEGDDACAE